MTLQEFFKTLDSVDIDMKCINILEEKYNTKLAEEIRKIISISNRDNLFSDGGRLLTFYEICNSDNEYGTKLVEMCLIPLFDLGDNIFVVYSTKELNWKKYSILDNIVFETNESLEAIFK